MYLQNGGAEGMIICEDEPNQKSETKENIIDVREEHNNLKRIRDERKCRDFSKMSYWQIVSHSTIL